MGIYVMMFTNEQVYERLDDVLEAIAQTVCELRQSTPPCQEEGETEKGKPTTIAITPHGRYHHSL
ncbi:hypothetical protein CSQ79_26735 [Gloeocapsopsis sp. IPPAS B-1203]|nr:hypothetical protein CSQ79_26735 [Gloeocapsopsis sp. IPPAS B-1203]